ncbi:bifunctional hydroxymethylpyrimidine kinase/phosphomethylpyrimidine kinase [bacterium]|nr:bifunctional hydroxymethylpyrimidine kinase/phosphomethylpyrimidine kinase [bacterium]
MIPRLLTIAGSDSGGGAGIQADLKTFTVFRAYGMSAITALTAQNTRGVHGIFPVSPAFVRAQIDAVVADIGVDAAKTGMLATRAIIEAVAEAVRVHRIAPLVVDPVMVAQSGARLLEDDARAALLAALVPLATVVTPNAPEAEALLDMRVATVAEQRAAARRLVELGAAAALVKGGHLAGPEAVDVLDDGHTVVELRAPRLDTPHTHGTGCMTAAALAACLGRGLPLPDAAREAKRFVGRAIAHGLAIGGGHGPANPLAWLDDRS